MAGGLIGELLALLVGSASGLGSRLMSVGAVVFSSRFTFTAMGAGLLAAIAIGLLGAVLPAWRAEALGAAVALSILSGVLPVLGALRVTPADAFRRTI